MQVRKVKISGTGKFLPTKKVTAEEMDEKLHVKQGWVYKKSGVHTRYFVTTETASYMGAQAGKRAMDSAGLTSADIDCIVCTSGTVEQAIPCTASLIQKELGEEYAGIPCFDVNSTCLSFVTGFDLLSTLVAAGTYKHVLLIASEVASVGLNWSHKESASLFGDGAAAVIISKTEDADASHIICSNMETYSDGAELSQIRGGGTKVHPRDTQGIEPYLFEMDGRAIYKLTAKVLPSFVDSLLEMSSMKMEDFDIVVTHQASAMAMRLMAKKLGISHEQLMYILPNYGNMIAASIPLAIHEAITQNQLKRGDKVLILGTSAGLSLGGMVLEY